MHDVEELPYCRTLLWDPMMRSLRTVNVKPADTCCERVPICLDDDRGGFVATEFVVLFPTEWPHVSFCDANGWRWTVSDVGPAPRRTRDGQREIIQVAIEIMLGGQGPGPHCLIHDECRRHEQISLDCYAVQAAGRFTQPSQTATAARRTGTA